MIAAHRSIPFKIVGSPESPFTFARKRKESIPEKTSEENVQSTSTATSRKPEEDTTEGQFSVEPTDETSVSISTPVIESEKDTDIPMEDQPAASSSRVQATVWLDTFGQYPTDPANFKGTKITAEQRAEIVRHGPCQPEGIKFTNNVEGRCFQPSWYKRNESKREWLVYSLKDEKMYCFCCWLFPCRIDKDFESNWSETGVDNFKKGIEKIRGHENSRLHCISLARWKSFEYRLLRGLTLDAEFQRQIANDREKTLLILDRLFSTTLFLALQGISFRSHRFESQEEMSNTENSGNYLELLQLLAKYDPVLAAHLSSKRSRGKYTSPQIQNEMINSIATVIRNQIIAEIQNAKFYCIILDTTPDISHKDQLAFSIRYVRDGKPLERFLCFEEMEGSKAVDFRDKLLHLLQEYNLNPDFIRGQAMDGCSTMSGIRGGLQALVKEI
eukprot:Seg4069.6 transcript_id=Seg4069.6/GoldUCD/mRNA.D3Y31 product="Zinc finger MYM-type protein 1" protein_id=Seg4069.6/GoldUCD/D3Y31